MPEPPPGSEAEDAGAPLSVISDTIAITAKALHLKSTDLLVLILFIIHLPYVLIPSTMHFLNGSLRIPAVHHSGSAPRPHQDRTMMLPVIRFLRVPGLPGLSEAKLELIVRVDGCRVELACLLSAEREVSS
jgi:hypothetical protein